MNRYVQSQVELRDTAPGLWIWRLQHPQWKPGVDWQPIVTSTCVASAAERLLLDPLAPPPGASGAWEWLDQSPPTAVVVLKPEHVRDADVFVRRYGACVRPEGISVRRRTRLRTEADPAR